MTDEDEDDDLVGELFPLDQQEDESDLNKKIDFQQTVVQTADWTVETLYGQLNKGTIDLDPGFQRRQAWDEVRKSRLIESLIAGLPIPNIVLAENTLQRGRFIVIDGKQRLLSIKDFLSDKFVLKGLDLRTDLEGALFSQLKPEDKDYLENNSIRATVVKNVPDPSLLYVLFFRLNSGSLQLSPQELRRALIGGNALDLIDEYLTKSTAFQAIFGSVLDKRMRDSELVLRYISFAKSYATYAGDLKKILDESLEYFETNWDATRAELEGYLSNLDLALNTSREIFKENTFKKWLGDKYERRINRAVFDVMVRFFSDPKVCRLALDKQQDIVNAFNETCVNQDFKSAIEKTTKSIGATTTRTNMWGERLAEELELNYSPDTARID